MALWGSRIERLQGFQGDTATAQPALPQFNPARLASGGLIDVPAPTSQLGRDQAGADVPLGPFVVTLSPITLANGGTIAGATGDIAQLTDYAAFVRWGRGGTKHEALIDWPVNGGTFTLAGDSIFVAAWALVPLSGVFTNAFRNVGIPISMGAWATPVRAMGRVAMPRRTMRLPSSLAQGQTSGEIFVPPFARRWHWQWNNTVVQGAWNLAFLYRRFGATFAQDILIGGSGTRGVLDGTIPGTGWDLPSATQTMVVNNNTGLALTVGDGALVFQLDLGA